MHRRLRSVVGRLLVLAVLGIASGALAQGVTGSAVQGVVRDPDNQPIPEAQVQLHNPSTGAVYNAVTGADGIYNLDNVQPGGPYSITVVAPGYEQKTLPGLTLALGQRMTLDIPLKYFGEEMVIVSHFDQLDDRNRTGNQSTMKDTSIAKLPLAGRNFTDLIAATPAATGSGSSQSFAGQNNRFNNIQIDGGANNDLFGLSNSGTPGGIAGARPLSVEAIQEFQVQVAPFDVRQGMFAGGLVNAITKSGTNDFHGAVYGYLQNKALSNQNAFINGVNQTDPTYNTYATEQFGAVIGGPIIKDKVHFFISADVQAKSTTFGNSTQLTGDPVADKGRAGFTTDVADRFQQDLINKGLANPGDWRAPTQSQPDRNLFIKIDSNQIPNSRLELSYNLVSASQDILNRTVSGSAPTLTNLRDGYQLSNGGYSNANTTNTVRAKLTTNFGEGKFSNEFLGSMSFVRDERSTPTNAPLILVDTGGTVGTAHAWLSAGQERFSQANKLDQNIFQLQDNLTWSLGSHRLTVGTSNEFFHFRNLFLQEQTGVWAFNSLDDFEANKVAVFERRFGASPLQEAGTAKFSVSQLGFYAQDEWSLPMHFTLQPGVRIDVPFLSSGVANPVLLANTALPIDTSRFPSGNIMWSPRLGFNWDPDGTNDTIVRGGVGVFTGRPPYVWLGNGYNVNGLSQVTLRCTGAGNTPAFTLDPSAQPTDCKGGTGTPAQPTTNIGEVDIFDPNLKYPQNARFAFGVDRRLPFGIVGSVDVLYTKDINGWVVTDLNLDRNKAFVNGEGRVIYGTPTATGSVSAARIDPKVLNGPVVEVYNQNGADVWDFTVQANKSFAQMYNISVAYTYSRSRDRMSLTSSQAFSNFQFAPLEGDIDNRGLAPSAFDQPHKITITGNAALPYGFGAGLIYIGQSGTPYTYLVGNDINGDGSVNDLVYVPKADGSDITLKDPTQLAALNTFINGQSCLSDARGQIIKRGACRNPWNDTFNMRFTWTSPNFKGDQHAEVQFDIFNVLNLLNPAWGHFDQVAGFENGPSFLRAVGYDSVHQRPVYSFTAPSGLNSTVYSPTASRWRMQFGARYVF